MSANVSTGNDLGPNDILDIVNAFFNALRKLLIALNIMKDTKETKKDTKETKTV